MSRIRFATYTLHYWALGFDSYPKDESICFYFIRWCFEISWGNDAV